MRSLIATALLLTSEATLDETSLMQGLARQAKLGAADAKQGRKDATAKLMETATKMMKNGATPDVVTFIETTITELNQNVLGAIVDEHNRDQQLINDLLDRFDAAVAAMEECAASVAQQHEDRTQASLNHKMCRQGEAIDCARSRRCEEELEELWNRVKIEETEMRRIHDAIHGEWCVGPAPDHPGLADPFHWTITEYSEGAETSQSVNDYPQVDLEPVVIEFRRFSVEYFGHYIVQKPIVEEAWEAYNRKLLECAALEETWTLKVDDCDELQIAVHDAACMHAASNRQCASNFGHEYHMTLVAYNNAVETIQALEYDRKREWETLKITTCLLETVYTHVLHSIGSGEPCPTTESHPEQTEQEIQHCHVVEESLTANLTINYGEPPPPPGLPPVVPPPCTAEYIWEEHGSFPFEVQASHSQAIEAEGLQAYFTVLSAFGWAGCAAPRACIPCETTTLMIDPAYVANEVCKEHHGHLSPGQIDQDTFKCLSGNECVHADGRCNGVANCDDGSDELGCQTTWEVPALLHTEECQEPFVSDLQFRCGDNTCAPAAGLCNGVNNCADGSDERNCATTTQHVTLEATSGYTSSIEHPEIGDATFYDRQYTFESLGSFVGRTFVKSSNEDKHTHHSHVQMKLRFDRPTTVYVVALQELPWLQAEGWTISGLEGPTYKGVRQTRHTDWSSELIEETYGPGRVWEKVFPAGTVEMRGNGAGDGSFLIFVAAVGEIEEPPLCCQALNAECLACAAELEVDQYCAEFPLTQGCETNPSACMLSAYWEHGSCGCAGDDHQQNWCGGINRGECAQSVQVATHICPSGTAHLQEFNGQGGAGAGRFWSRGGCDYIWHAQYACDAPVCCEALTAECLACAARLEVRTYCAQNPDTAGCSVQEPAPLTDATITSSTPTGWQRNPSVIRYGQVGLVGHWWKQLQVTFAFPSAMTVTGLETDDARNAYTAWTSMDGNTWQQQLSGARLSQNFAGVEARYARIRWENTEGSHGIHAHFLGYPA